MEHKQQKHIEAALMMMIVIQTLLSVFLWEILLLKGYKKMTVTWYVNRSPKEDDVSS
jgi:hypothetical protein